MTQGNSRLVLQGQQILLNEWFVHAEAGEPAKRIDMQPAQFLAELAYISIVEQAGGDFVFRLGGTEIRRVLGAEPRGSLDRQLESLGGDAVWSEKVRKALTTGRPVFGASDIGYGQTHWWLRLPLCDDAGRQRLVLCHDRIIDNAQTDEEIAVPVQLDTALSVAA